MNRVLPLLALTALASAPCLAGDFSQLAISAKLTVSEGCTALTCTSSIKAKVAVQAEAAISPSEASAIGPDTEFNIDDPVFGDDLTITPGEDPNYQPGDTSARVVTAVSRDGGILTITTDLDWGTAGKLILKQTSKGKGSTTSPHLNEKSILAPAVFSLVTTPRIKSHDPETFTFIISAENGGIDFFTATGTMLMDVKVAEILDSRASGQVTETLQATIKPKGFISPIPPDTAE